MFGVLITCLLWIPNEDTRYILYLVTAGDGLHNGFQMTTLNGIYWDFSSPESVLLLTLNQSQGDSDKMGHFTLARLRARLRKIWADPEPSLSLAFQCEQGWAQIFSAGLEFLIRAVGCSHWWLSSGSAWNPSRSPSRASVKYPNIIINDSFQGIIDLFKNECECKDMILF